MKRMLVSMFCCVAATACTEPGTVPLVFEPFEPGASCDIVREVMGPYCVSCHDGTIEPLDLRGPALGDLVGKVGDEFGQVLVVAGDPDASFLYQKCTGPGTDLGDPMPQGRTMPQSAIDALRAWIEDGAPACTVTGADIIVGGPVDFGSPPSDFVAVRPSWAATGICGSEQWWRHPGMLASPSMHPGNDCVGCHSLAGGPGFAYAGTVYPTLIDPDDCRGVPGVTVEILDEGGNTVARAETNEAGNFDLSGRYVDGYRARLTYQSRTREMTLPVTGNGSCNSCHGPSGAEGAPGRMVAP